MATITCWSVNFTKQPDTNISRSQASNLVKCAERRVFPRTEALDLDVELRKSNTDLMIILDENTVTRMNKLVAYIVCSRHKKLVLLHKVCVLEVYRRRGIARRMIEMQKGKFRDQGCEKMQLWVDEKRMPARRLYAALGFLEMSRVEDYYAPCRTGIQMAILLSEP